MLPFFPSTALALTALGMRNGMTVSAHVIQTIHVIVIALVIAGPYIRTDGDPLIRNQWLARLGFRHGIFLSDILYVVSGIGLMLHWAMNSDVCVLTQLEGLVRGAQSTDSFLKRLIRPIYIITDRNLKHLSYAVVLTNLTYIFFYKYRDTIA